MRAAIEGAGGNDVIASAGNGGHRKMHRRLPAGGCDRPHPAFQSADALFKHGIGGVRQARIDMPGALDVEEPHGEIRVREHKRRRLIDGRRPRPGRRIRTLPRVQRQRIESGRPRPPMLSLCHEEQPSYTLDGPPDIRGKAFCLP